MKVTCFVFYSTLQYVSFYQKSMEHSHVLQVYFVLVHLVILSVQSCWHLRKCYSFPRCWVIRLTCTLVQLDHCSSQPVWPFNFLLSDGDPGVSIYRHQSLSDIIPKTSVFLSWQRALSHLLSPSKGHLQDKQLSDPNWSYRPLCVMGICGMGISV